jgi:hypothetical protein
MNKTYSRKEDARLPCSSVLKPTQDTENIVAKHGVRMEILRQISKSNNTTTRHWRFKTIITHLFKNVLVVYAVIIRFYITFEYYFTYPKLWDFLVMNLIIIAQEVTAFFNTLILKSSDVARPIYLHAKTPFKASRRHGSMDDSDFVGCESTTSCRLPILRTFRRNMLQLLSGASSTVCPTRYRTWHFFNNFTTNEDISTKFEADLPHWVRNVTTS